VIVIFPENIIHALLLVEMVSIRYCNAIQIVRTVFDKIVILYFGVYAKSPYAWSCNV
jgi:hypothetical protein